MIALTFSIERVSIFWFYAYVSPRKSLRTLGSFNLNTVINF